MLELLLLLLEDTLLPRLVDTELLPRLTDEELLLFPLRLLDTVPLLLRELELEALRLALLELRDLLLWLWLPATTDEVTAVR